MILCCKTAGGSLCCLVFSFIAVVFLLFIAFLFEVQWEYLEEIGSQETAELARTNAYRTSALYGFTMLLSSFFYIYNTKKSHQLAMRRDSDGEIPLLIHGVANQSYGTVSQS